MGAGLREIGANSAFAAVKISKSVLASQQTPRVEKKESFSLDVGRGLVWGWILSSYAPKEAKGTCATARTTQSLKFQKLEDVLAHVAGDSLGDGAGTVGKKEVPAEPHQGLKVKLCKARTKTSFQAGSLCGDLALAWLCCLSKQITWDAYTKDCCH